MVYRGTFALFDNEERCVKADTRIRVINLNLKAIEKIILQDTITTGPRSWSGKLIYSKKNNYFIGCSKTFRFSSAYNNIGTTVPIPQSKGVLYPNPASDYIEISVPRWRGQGVDICIFDILGVLQLPRPDGHPFVLEGEVLRIDVSALAAGVYFVRVGDDVRKFVKI